MKRQILITVAGCLAVLAIGLALAYPLLTSEMPITKLDLDVDVVYAYIGNPDLNANVTGLWRNSSLPSGAVDVNGNRLGFDVHAVSFLLVLNITNPSNNLVRIRNFMSIAGPQISLTGTNGGVGAEKPILIYSRNNADLDDIPFDVLWQANESRLIYLSGFVGVHDLAYEALNSGAIYVYASADGGSFDGDASCSGNFLEKLPFQNFNGNYLYNNLVSDNQMLVFYSGMDVFVGTRD
jgi:hypothetical protein